MSSEVVSFYQNNNLNNVFCLQDIICDVIDYYKFQRVDILGEYQELRSRPKSKKTHNKINSLSIDFNIINLKIQELEYRLRKLKNKERQFYKLSKKGAFRMKKISNKTKKVIEKEGCSICFDTHKIKYMFTTKCRHHFGDCCFGKYVEHTLENSTQISCPLCRNNNILPVVKYC